MVNQASNSGEKRPPASTGQQLIKFITTLVMVCYYLAVAIVLVIKLCFWGGLLILVTWLLWETLKFAVNYL